MSGAKWALAALLLAVTVVMGWRLMPGRELPYVNPNDPGPRVPVRPRPPAPPAPAPPVAAPTPPAPPAPAPLHPDAIAAGLVDVRDVVPGIVLDVRYATADNFLGRAVYPVARVLLARDAAARLARVQAALAARGLGLKIYDGYRPLTVQRAMWALVPDPRYVADPKKGSRHNRGAAVDVTLVDAAGIELEMPTAYDDFSPRAAADAEASPSAMANRAILRDAMAREGFRVMPSEWWHFDAPGADRLPLLDVPLVSPEVPSP